MGKEKYILVIGMILVILSSKLDFHGQEEVIFEDVQIKVQVDGAVENPGIYELEVNSSIQDLLDLAVVREDADLSAINPFIILKDRDVLHVPYYEENKLSVSINTGSKEELMQLPGIGEKTAQAILDYRNTYGLFQTLDDLKKVKGIGDKKLEKIREFIRL